MQERRQLTFTLSVILGQMFSSFQRRPACPAEITAISAGYFGEYYVS